jgi:hypothetical protein
VRAPLDQPLLYVPCGVSSCVLTRTQVLESRGNAPGACGPGQGNGGFGSMLHFGFDSAHNAMMHAHTEAALPERQRGSLADNFHVFGLEWTTQSMYTYLDTPENRVRMGYCRR